MVINYNTLNKKRKPFVYSKNKFPSSLLSLQPIKIFFAKGKRVIFHWKILIDIFYQVLD